MLTKRILGYSFCLESMFSSKQHLIKEKDLKRDKVFSQTKTIFSKDRKSKLFKLTDIKLPDINPEKSEHFIFDKNTVPIQRQVYVAPIKRAVKMNIQRKEYQMYKQRQLEKEEEIDEKFDELWDGEPPIRYQEKISCKEQFFNYRSPKYQYYIERKNSFLSKHNLQNGAIMEIINKIKQQSENELGRIFHPNYFIEDHYKTLPDLFAQLKIAIQEAPFQQLPQIALALQFELFYKEDIYKIWSEVEKTVYAHIHHFTPQQLIQLKRGFATTYPKVCDYQMHQIIYQLLLEDYNRLSVDDLVEALFAFRLMNSDQFSRKIIATLIEKLPEYENNYPKLAQVFYSISNNLQKKHLRTNHNLSQLDYQYRLDIANRFAPLLKKGQYDMDDCTRILIGLNNLRVSDFHDLSFAIEQQIKDPDEFQTAHILYALSKGSNGMPLGQQETYDYLFPFAQKYFDSYANLEKSRIYFAYSTVNSKHAKSQFFLDWVKSNILRFNFADLQNVAYSLMYNEVSDKNIWMNFVKNICYNREAVPLANYFCFKQAKFYVSQFYPEWNLTPYEEASKDAEYNFMAHRVSHNIINSEFITFQQEINSETNYEWKTFYTLNNLYYLPMVLQSQRIAVILAKPRAQLQLQKKIMESLDWKLLIFDPDHIFGMKQKDRIQFYKDTIDTAINSQKEKMAIWEQKRREEIYDQVISMTERSITPGKRMVTDDDVKDLSRQPI